MDVLVKNIFYGNPEKSLWCYDEQKNHEYMEYEHTVDTVAVCMPIYEMPIDIWFISIV
jgi:hypothetical protein